MDADTNYTPVQVYTQHAGYDHAAACQAVFDHGYQAGVAAWLAVSTPAPAPAPAPAPSGN